MSSDNLAQNPTNFFVPFQNDVHPTDSIPASKAHPHIPPCCGLLPKTTDETVIYDWRDVSVASDEKDESVPKSCHLLTNDEIRKKMISLRQDPSPINSTTKRLYSKKLWKLENGLNIWHLHSLSTDRLIYCTLHCLYHLYIQNSHPSSQQWLLYHSRYKSIGPAGGLGVAFFATSPGWVLNCISFWNSNLPYLKKIYPSIVSLLLLIIHIC